MSNILEFTHNACDACTFTFSDSVRHDMAKCFELIVAPAIANNKVFDTLTFDSEYVDKEKLNIESFIKHIANNNQYMANLYFAYLNGDTEQANLIFKTTEKVIKYLGTWFKPSPVAVDLTISHLVYLINIFVGSENPDVYIESHFNDELVCIFEYAEHNEKLSAFTQNLIVSSYINGFVTN